MRPNGLALRIPHWRGEINKSNPRRSTLWARAKEIWNSDAINGLTLAWGVLLAWGLVLFLIVSLGSMSAGTKIQISPAPMDRSNPDLPVVYESGMIFQNEEERIYYVL